jgi:hypothetical protein
MRHHEVHSTQNLYEGSYLLACGFRIDGKDRKERKISVRFEGVGVEAASLKFYNGGKVEAKALMDSYRTLKDYIFED